MAVLDFPDIEEADHDGLLALGGDLEPESLIMAYTRGIFPWPLDPELLAWFAPPKRTVLFSRDLHISRSMKHLLKNHNYTLSLNTDFDKVIYHCQQVKNRKGQRGTWITDEIVEGYSRLHQLGAAYSVECFRDKEIVGGLYGVQINGFVSGESMFHLEANCSKLCLIFLMSLLATQRVKWIDCQMTTPLLKSFGAKELERTDFQELLGQQLLITETNLASRKLTLHSWQGEPIDLNTL